jgi:hypothetical protein
MVYESRLPKAISPRKQEGTKKHNVEYANLKNLLKSSCFFVSLCLRGEKPLPVYTFLYK